MAMEVLSGIKYSSKILIITVQNRDQRPCHYLTPSPHIATHPCCLPLSSLRRLWEMPSLFSLSMPSDAVAATAAAVALSARTAPPETSSNREPSLRGARNNLVS